MCEFLSFLVNASVLVGEPLTVYLGNPNSHGGLEAGWNLRPEDYFQAEWMGDKLKSLDVRTHACTRHFGNTTFKQRSSLVRAAIVAEFPTRTHLLMRMREGLSKGGMCLNYYRYRFVPKGAKSRYSKLYFRTYRRESGRVKAWASLGDVAIIEDDRWDSVSLLHCGWDHSKYEEKRWAHSYSQTFLTRGGYWGETKHSNRKPNKGWYKDFLAAKKVLEGKRGVEPICC